MVATSPTIHNGTFTIESPRGGHRTFRIRTQKKDATFAPGKRVVALMDGPDNESSYRPFGFVNDTGIVVWAKFRGMMKLSAFDHYACMVWEMGTNDNSRYHQWGYELLLEGRCIICNRKLTTPGSIRSGVGPICAGR